MSVKEKVRERGEEGQEKGELEERGREEKRGERGGKEERQRGRKGKGRGRKKEKEGGRRGDGEKRGRERRRRGDGEDGRRREVSKSTTKIAESRTGRTIREVIPGLSFNFQSWVDIF